MFIEELHLISYKGFNDFKLKCSQFTTLVGMNSSGKTSILQAIQLVHDIYKYVFGGYDNSDIQRPNFIQPLWSSDYRFKSSGVIERQNSGDPDALWLNKKTSIPCKITLKLTTGFEIKLEITGREKYTLDILENNKSISNQIQEPEYQKHIEDFFLLFPTFVPPTASLPPIEKFIYHSELRQKLDKGLIAECWRSYLYWLCNDGDHRNSNRVVEIVQRYLPDTVLKLPQLTHEHPPQVLIEFEENETNFDISVSGGGLRTISSLAVILHFSKSRCLLLDEPDAHLHSTLQHQVAQMLLDHSIEKNIQVFMTSHAPDFIAEIPVEYLTWIDRTKHESRNCNGVGQFLADLGAVTKADAVRNYGADKILFVEGGIDRIVLSQLVSYFCEQDSTRINPFKDSSVIIAELPDGKGDSKHLDAFRKLLFEAFKLDVKVACIVDNDYDIPINNYTEDVDDSDTLLLRLQRKEIENYLLDYAVIAKSAADLVEQRKKYTEKSISCPTVEEIQTEVNKILNSSKICSTVKYQVVPKYRESLDNSLDSSTKELKGEEWFDENWSDESWRIRNCPGKEVLTRLRDWCQKTYSLTITSHKLATTLQECPDDVQEIMEKLQKYFYS
ncbi:MAG: AAA family ATPase [Nostoc sp.]|uniref:ATP-dependent nuclease n=1 Tax=Nostoc sp. TaxID=1180 RepID=UPI002FFA64AE